MKKTKDKKVALADVADGCFLDERQAAEFLNIAPLTLYRWRKKPPKGSPRIPYVKIGRTIFFDRDQLKGWVLGHQAPGEGLPKTKPASKVGRSSK